MYLIKCIGVIELSREEHGLIVHLPNGIAFHTYLILSSVNAVVGNSVIWKDGTENAVPISQISGISQSRPKITENAVIPAPIKCFFCMV